MSSLLDMAVGVVDLESNFGRSILPPGEQLARKFVQAHTVFDVLPSRLIGGGGPENWCGGGGPISSL